MHADKQIKISPSLLSIQSKKIIQQAKETLKYSFLESFPAK